MRASFVFAIAFGGWLIVGSTGDAQTLTSPGVTASPSQLPGPELTPIAATSSTGPIAMSEVVSLSKAGLDDDVIIAAIRQRGAGQSLSVDNLIYLRQQGVSNEVIKSLQTAGSPPKTIAASSTVQPVSPAPAASTSTSTPTILQPAPATTYQVQPQTVIVQQPPVVVRPYPYSYWGPAYYPCYGPPAFWNFGYHHGHHGGSSWSFGVGGW